MVMEWCAGGSLEDLISRLIKSGQRLDESDFFIIARGIAIGMKHLSSNGIVHRDVR
jgi:serine/threonine protein kinase